MFPVSGIITQSKLIRALSTSNSRIVAVCLPPPATRVSGWEINHRWGLQWKAASLVGYSALWFHKIFKLYKCKAYLHSSSTLRAMLLNGEWIRDISLHLYQSTALRKSLVLILLIRVCFMFHKGKLIKCHWQKYKLFGIYQRPRSCWLDYLVQ